MKVNQLIISLKKIPLNLYKDLALWNQIKHWMKYPNKVLIHPKRVKFLNQKNKHKRSNFIIFI